MDGLVGQMSNVSTNVPYFREITRESEIVHFYAWWDFAWSTMYSIGCVAGFAMDIKRLSDLVKHVTYMYIWTTISKMFLPFEDYKHMAIWTDNYWARSAFGKTISDSRAIKDTPWSTVQRLMNALSKLHVKKNVYRLLSKIVRIDNPFVR